MCRLEFRDYDAQPTASSCSWVVKDVVASAYVIQHEAILFQKPNQFARLNGGEFRHTRVPALSPDSRHPLESVRRASSDFRCTRQLHPSPDLWLLPKSCHTSRILAVRAHWRYIRRRAPG